MKQCTTTTTTTTIVEGGFQIDTCEGVQDDWKMFLGRKKRFGLTGAGQEILIHHFRK